MSPTKTSYFLLLHLLLPCVPNNAQPVHQICGNTENYSSDSAFGTNLKTILSIITSNAVCSIYFPANLGNNMDTVFGLSNCRADVDNETRKKCVNKPSQEITARCPNKTSTVWYDHCMLRYSDQRLYSKYEPAAVYSSNTQTVTEPDRFYQAVDGLIANFSMAALDAPLKKPMFAMGNVNFTSSQSIYGLVQCAPDLSKTDCTACLENARSQIQKCCYEKQGGRVAGTTCYLRFETYQFYNTLRADTAQEPPPGEGRDLVRVIIISVAAALGVVICCYLWQRRRSQQGKEESTVVLLHPMGMAGENGLQAQDLPLIDFAKIQAATNNFSDENKLGQGGFGPVYKGVLPDGEKKAVKRLSRSSEQGVEEFKNEVRLMAELQHRNLVRLLYCCIKREEKLLVYEYMPNTSPDVFLFDPTKRVQLDWERCNRIVRGIARGILYLHEDSLLKIIHRDLKAGNVLLDNEMNPKISDFGMAWLFGGNQSQARTKRVVGTYGYMAPEYAMHGIFSVKSDVFSFGVILLELVSGNKNNSLHLPENTPTLLTYAWRLWCEKRVIELIDPWLMKSVPTTEALRWLHISLLCVQEDAADRPTMSSIVVMLKSKIVPLPQPTQPGFYLEKAAIDKVCSINEVTISTLQPR